MPFDVRRRVLDNIASRLPRTTRHRVYVAARAHFGRFPPRIWTEGGADYSLSYVFAHRCIFIHIPKTGGISWAYALFGNKGAGHARAGDYLASLGATEFDRLFKFSIIRNPYDRLVSAYWYLMGGGLNDGDRAFAESFLSRFSGFDDFVLHGLPEAAETWVHFLPQWCYVIDPRTNRICTDALVPFDAMENGFNEVCRRLGRKVSLPRLNPAKRRPDLSSAFTPETQAAAYRVYREDFERLGFGLDGTPPPTGWPAAANGHAEGACDCRGVQSAPPRPG